MIPPICPFIQPKQRAIRSTASMVGRRRGGIGLHWTLDSNLTGQSLILFVFQRPQLSDAYPNQMQVWQDTRYS